MFKFTPSKSKFRVFGLAALDPSTEDFRNRILAKGATISDAALSATDQLLTGLKADGIWDSLVDVGIFVGSNFDAALTKLKYSTGVPSDLANYGFTTSSYSQSLGINPGINNSSAPRYLDTGLNESALISINTHLAFYTPSSNAHGDNPQRDIGNGSSDGFQFALNYSSTNSFTFYRSVGGSGEISAPPNTLVNPKGFFLACRSSGGGAIYANGAAIATSNATIGQVSPQTGKLAIFKATAQQGSSRVISFYSIGLFLNSSQATKYYARIQSFQSALGRAV